MVDGVNPKGVWSPFGAFSMAVIQGDGQIVHLKGQVALDRHGEVIGGNDMRAQVRKVLENIRDVLASMGGLMGDIASLVHYAVDTSNNSWALRISARNSSRRRFLSQQPSKCGGSIAPIC
jgi:enamine deaminase RidA (YjgF/YER057c/UK114 family)